MSLPFFVHRAQILESVSKFAQPIIATGGRFADPAARHNKAQRNGPMLITVEDTETFLGSLEAYAAERAGVHRTTVQRWRRRGWPPLLLRLAALERGGHLGLIHEAWKGWRIESSGELIAPPELSARPFRPKDLIAAPILFQLQRELERMRADPRRVEHAATLPPVQLTVIR